MKMTLIRVLNVLGLMLMFYTFGLLAPDSLRNNSSLVIWVGIIGSVFLVFGGVLSLSSRRQ
jgi:hypothetical protein